VIQKNGGEKVAVQGGLNARAPPFRLGHHERHEVQIKCMEVLHSLLEDIIEEMAPVPVFWCDYTSLREGYICTQ
jgi:hypothetical protein